MLKRLLEYTTYCTSSIVDMHVNEQNLHVSKKSCVFGIEKSEPPPFNSAPGTVDPIPIQSIMMNVLLSLPVEVWRDQILSFLELLDVVTADSSCLNHAVRRRFIMLTEGGTLLSNGNGERVDTKQHGKMKWCLARNILPSSISIEEDLCLQTASTLPSFVARVTNLSLTSSNMQFIEPASCPRLKQLHVNVCSGESLGSLSVCPDLTDLLLRYCGNVSTESLRQSLSGCNQLEQCTIISCGQLEERAIAYIIRSNPRLKTLVFGGKWGRPYDLVTILQVPDENVIYSVRTIIATDFTTVCSRGLQRLAKLFPLLHKLHLDDSSSPISDHDIDTLCQHCRQLMDLSLQSYSTLTSAALKSVAQYLPMLEKVAMSGCNNITDEGVITIVQECAHLNLLDISYCNNITDEAVRAVWLHRPLLSDISLKGCWRITDAAFAGKVNTALRKLDVCGTVLNGSYLKYAPMLRTLHCDACGFSDFAHRLAAQANSIQRLCMENTRLSVSDLLLLSAHLPEVEYVSMRHSTATDEVVRGFVKNCPQLRSLDMEGSAVVNKAVVDELYQQYQPRKFRIHI